MYLCKKCSMMSGALLALAGLGLLLQDLTVWIFWGLTAGSLFLLILGVTMFARTLCHDCMSGCMPKRKK